MRTSIIKGVIRIVLVFFVPVFLCLAPARVAGQYKHINVVADERMELISTIEMLAGQVMQRNSYTDSVAVYFAPYKKHAAVTLVKSMLNNSAYSGSSLVWYLYQFSFPALKPEGRFTEDENQVGNYEMHLDTLSLFRERLRDFYTKTGFHTFFLEHKGMYDSLCTPVSDYINKMAVAETVEAMFGGSKSSYSIVLAPLFKPGGIGIQTHKTSGDYVTIVIGPTASNPDALLFAPALLFQDFVLHELSHAFCDPFVHKFISMFNTDSCLSDTISHINTIVRQDYGGDWESCVAEHLARANEVVLCRKLLGDQIADQKLEQGYFKEKWLLLEGLVPILENDYLGNRIKYKTEGDLVPSIVDYFDEMRKNLCH